MAKTGETIEMERKIFSTTNKMGTFGCFEVTIGFNGKERVDYITYDTKGIWRCYEIKVSKQDFYSDAKKSFVGNYNYFVMPYELYEEVKNDIPKHVGVYASGSCVKRARKQALQVDEQVLKDSLIRSLFREFEKQFKSGNPLIVESLNRKIDRLEKEKRDIHRNYVESQKEKNKIIRELKYPQNKE